MKHEVEFEIAGKVMSLQTGQVAKQANAAVLARLEDTMILATVVGEKEAREDRGFLPLSVEYREKAYAAGKIPGGFFKRESRPGEKEILSARLVDRPLRPLFPEGYNREVQIAILVLSSDQETDADILGLIGAATALNLSDIPFHLPLAAVRIGKIAGEYVVNPSFSELENSEIDIIVAGTEDSIVMLEGGAREVSEDVILDGVTMAHEYIRQIIAKEKELVAKAGKSKLEFTREGMPGDLQNRMQSLAVEKIREANDIRGKKARQEVLDELIDRIRDEFEEDYDEHAMNIRRALFDLEKEDLRRRIMEGGQRLDGRSPDEIRNIECAVGILPRAHGSGLFTRGETQSLAAVTLGTKTDEQIVDDLEGESKKSYMLHYNFPPFSVGEIRPFRGPARREIGHGALAERAISPVIPEEEHFPYTIRIVSDILESNGSSSMATICGGSLALMDAGVPIKSPVAGIAMGMVTDGEKNVLLTDILGIEDHMGDLDCKVAGTSEGITALQMDIKIKGIEFDILKKVFAKAREGRLKVLETMERTIDRPRESISVFAPKIYIHQIDQEKIGDLIGPGGKTIRKIIQDTDTQISIEEDGRVTISSDSMEKVEKALDIIKAMMEEVEVGKIYTGNVTRVTPFGAFVQIIPGKEGLLHISEIEHYRIRRVEDVLNKGDEVQVKVIGIDDQGRINLTRKELLENDHRRTQETRHRDPSSRGRDRGSDRGSDRRSDRGSDRRSDRGSDRGRRPSSRYSSERGSRSQDDRK
jgi:polyribonucleotide nucleotidyltransferase